MYGTKFFMCQKWSVSVLIVPSLLSCPKWAATHSKNLPKVADQVGKSNQDGQAKLVKPSWLVKPPLRGSENRHIFGRSSKFVSFCHCQFLHHFYRTWSRIEPRVLGPCLNPFPARAPSSSHVFSRIILPYI